MLECVSSVASRMLKVYCRLGKFAYVPNPFSEACIGVHPARVLVHLTDRPLSKNDPCNGWVQVLYIFQIVSKPPRWLGNVSQFVRLAISNETNHHRYDDGESGVDDGFWMAGISDPWAGRK